VLATIRNEIRRLNTRVDQRMTREPEALRRLRADPSRFLDDAGFRADPWQRDLLRANHPRTLLLATRQGGKSQTAAGLALKQAMLVPGSLVLLLSPTLRQSGELFKDKVKCLYNALKRPVATVQESALTMELENRSRIVSLPGDEGTIRGYSGAKLLILDEASRIPDELYRTVRPMLATSKGKLIALTTPWGQRGWFFEAWHSQEQWHRIKITADQIPRISPEFLAEEKAALGEKFYLQEYFGSFESVVGALFTEEVIQAALSDEVQPLDL
jgi:phage terminase large subunit-like protein